MFPFALAVRGALTTVALFLAATADDSKDPTRWQAVQSNGHVGAQRRAPSGNPAELLQRIVRAPGPGICPFDLKTVLPRALLATWPNGE
jgi:hypothetical protein